MPIYEYRCSDCRKKSSVFFRSFSDTETKAATCEHCGSQHLDRLISKVAVMRPWGESLNWPGEAVDDYDEDDPKSMARWMRRMQQESGEGFGGEMKQEIEQMIQQMEAGEMPDMPGDIDTPRSPDDLADFDDL